MSHLISTVLAEITNPVVPASQKDPVAFTNSTLQLIFSIFMIIGTLYFVWHFVFAGYHFISSQGDPKAYEQAKNEITHGLIGISIVFSVFVLLKVIGLIFHIPGLDNLQLTLPTL